jgi:hypothetical protein
LEGLPFSLIAGDSVFVKVIATNSKGPSVDSDSGNGALILTKPDAPISLAEVTAQRDATSLGL